MVFNQVNNVAGDKGTVNLMDLYAAVALLSNEKRFTGTSPTDQARWAWDVAVAMMAEREKRMGGKA